MTNNEERELYELIRNLSRGLKKHGVKKVINALKKINTTTENEINYSIIEYVENLVCAKLGVPKEELFGFSSRGEITIARKLCILLIRKYVNKISDAEVGLHYNRSRQVIHNVENEFKSLKEGKKNKFQIDFLKLHTELELDVDAFVEKIKNNTK